MDLVNFEPNVGGGYQAFPPGGGTNLCCQSNICSAQGGFGSSCTIKPGKDPNSYYCGGCTKCTIFHCYVDNGIPDAYVTSPSGSYLIEASDITIIH